MLLGRLLQPDYRVVHRHDPDGESKPFDLASGTSGKLVRVQGLERLGGRHRRKPSRDSRSRLGKVLIHRQLPGTEPNEISRASMGGSVSAAAGGWALTEPGPHLGGLLTGGAPAGSPEIGLLMGCRASFGVST